MEQWMFLFVPLVVALTLSAFLYAISKYGIKTKELETSSLKEQKASSLLQVFNTLNFSVLVIILLILIPWIVFYVISGSRLSYIDSFLTVTFISSLVIVPTINFYKYRGRWK